VADFYQEEPVSDLTAARLVELGHSNVDAKQILPRGTSDHTHLATAARLRRILLTINSKDFRLLHAAWRDWFLEWGEPPYPRHAGILIIPQPPSRSPIAGAELVHALVASLTAGESLDHRLFWWSSGLGWREDPPAAT
jgi:hypothetical protein